MCTSRDMVYDFYTSFAPNHIVMYNVHAVRSTMMRKRKKKRTQSAAVVVFWSVHLFVYVCSPFFVASAVSYKRSSTMYGSHKWDFCLLMLFLLLLLSVYCENLKTLCRYRIGHTSVKHSSKLNNIYLFVQMCLRSVVDINFKCKIIHDANEKNCS